MKILMVTKNFPPRFAGATVQAIYLSKQLINKGIEVDFVADNYVQTTELKRYEGLTVHKISTCSDQNILIKINELIFSVKLFFFITFNPQYDVIFFHGAGSFEIFLFFLCKLQRRKIILELTLVDNDDPLTLKNRKLGFLFYHCLKCLDKIIPISTQLRKLSLMAGLEESKLELIPVGVDTSRFSLISPQEKQSLKQKMGYGVFSRIFLAVGQVEDRKGYVFMLSAWRILSMIFPNSLLLIAGPKNDTSHQFYNLLIEKMERESIKNVKFLGLVKNVNELMNISDCLLHCALKEGLPNTLVEAALSGVPIVCRKMEGITSDIIINKNIGREVTGDSAQVFAEQVRATLNEHNIHQSTSDIFELKKRFDIQKVAEKYIRLFNRLVPLDENCVLEKKQNELKAIPT